MEQNELITQINAKIRELARSAYEEGDHPVELLCECGCLKRVSVLASAYDGMEGPVLLDGHEARRADEAADAPAVRDRGAWRLEHGRGGLPSEA